MTTRLQGIPFRVHPRAKCPKKYYVADNIHDAYVRPSWRKVCAWVDVKNMCKLLNGHGLCVSSANTNFFSAMFDFEHPETGELMRAVITPSYNHAYYLANL